MISGLGDHDLSQNQQLDALPTEPPRCPCTKHILTSTGPFQKRFADTQQESLIFLSVRCLNNCFIIQINTMGIGLDGPISPWSAKQTSDRLSLPCCGTAMSRSKRMLTPLPTYHTVDGILPVCSTSLFSQLHILTNRSSSFIKAENGRLKAEQ